MKKELIIQCGKEKRVLELETEYSDKQIVAYVDWLDVLRIATLVSEPK